jgi:hypothetical protein
MKVAERHSHGPKNISTKKLVPLSLGLNASIVKNKSSQRFLKLIGKIAAKCVLFPAE